MLLAIVAAITTPGAISPSTASAYFQENLPPDFGRDFRLEYSIETANNPHDDLTHTQMALSLVRADGEYVRFVTYILNITKVGDNTILLRDTFQSENGTLVLDMIHADGAVRIFGVQEPFLNAWQAEPGGAITINFPFEKDVEYRLRVEILTMDSFRNLLSDPKAAVADIVFSPDNPSSASGITNIPEFPFAIAVMTAAILAIIVLGTFTTLKRMPFK